MPSVPLFGGDKTVQIPLGILRCTCPDFRQRADANQYGQYLSQQYDRNWSDSGTAFQRGTEPCVHIWWVKRALGQVEGIPQDIPTAEPMKTSNQFRGKLVPGAPQLGDDFGF